MTARTKSPSEVVATFVSHAERVIDRALSIHRPELCRAALPVTISVVVGAGWSVIVDDAQVDKGADPALSDLAMEVTRHAVKSLDVEAQSRLLQKMQIPEERCDAGPYFVVALVVDGETFSLKVDAISGRFRACVGHCEGLLEPQAEMAAA